MGSVSISERDPSSFYVSRSEGATGVAQAAPFTASFSTQGNDISVGTSYDSLGHISLHVHSNHPLTVILNGNVLDPDSDIPRPWAVEEEITRSHSEPGFGSNSQGVSQSIVGESGPWSRFKSVSPYSVPQSRQLSKSRAATEGLPWSPDEGASTEQAQRSSRETATENRVPHSQLESISAPQFRAKSISAGIGQSFQSSPLISASTSPVRDLSRPTFADEEVPRSPLESVSASPDQEFSRPTVVDEQIPRSGFESTSAPQVLNTPRHTFVENRWSPSSSAQGSAQLGTRIKRKPLPPTYVYSALGVGVEKTEVTHNKVDEQSAAPEKNTRQSIEQLSASVKSPQAETQLELNVIDLPEHQQTTTQPEKFSSGDLLDTEYTQHIRKQQLQKTLESLEGNVPQIQQQQRKSSVGATSIKEFAAKQQHQKRPSIVTKRSFSMSTSQNSLGVSGAAVANKQKAKLEATKQREILEEKLRVHNKANPDKQIPFPKYRFQEIIGKGSYGRVYKW